jgi:hypothetical protein
MARRMEREAQVTRIWTAIVVARKRGGTSPPLREPAGTRDRSACCYLQSEDGSRQMEHTTCTRWEGLAKKMARSGEDDGDTGGREE